MKIMNKRLLKTLISLIILLIMLLPSASCSRQSDEESLAIARDLIDRAYTLNVVYYGEGLPFYDDDDNNVAGNYYRVRDDAPFTIRNDLLVETKAVFSENLADGVISVYLDGTSNMGVVVYARYLTGPDGYLAVYKDYDNSVENVQKYDTSTVKLLKNRKNKMVVSVSTTDGSEQIEVELVYEKNGWRIDSMTY